MPKLKDLPIFDLSGGLITDRSDLLIADNELKNSLNYDLDESGRLRRRRGIQQFGTTASGILDDSYLFFENTATPLSWHIVVDKASNAKIYFIEGTYTTLAITTVTTTITAKDTTDFAASGNIEINGDIIAYSGKGGTTFTGCTGIRVAHPAFSLVQQTSSGAALTIDTREGVYFTVVNNKLLIDGRVGMTVFSGGSVAAVAGEPSAMFATTYRNRVYAAGIASNAQTTYFSAAGDATDWTPGTDFFISEDDLGEPITGYSVSGDVLLIFKFNSIFAYDEIQLKQRLWKIGAYNHKVIQKIGNLIYTFCPTGVWVTNGSAAERISDPIKKYLVDFNPIIPQFSGIATRVVTNCFSGQLDNKYFLYIGDITVEGVAMTDVVLIYDTIKKRWTVHDSYTNIVHFASLTGFHTTADTGDLQARDSLFAGDTSGKYWRLFENRFKDSESTVGFRGGDLTADMVSNNVGNAIQTIAETKWYNIGDEPTQWAKVRRISVLTEKGTFQVSYRLDRGDNITDWISLGDFKTTITTVKLRENLNTAYRIAFKITSNERDILNIFNGIILKERETIEQEKYGISR